MTRPDRRQPELPGENSDRAAEPRWPWLGGCQDRGNRGLSSSAAGSCGNLIGAWLGPPLPRRATYAIGFLIGGAPLFVALEASSTLWPPLTVAFIGGLSTSSINPILGAVAYERIPPPLLARVMGVVRASAWVGLPIGPLLAGILVDNAGLQTALLVAAAGMLAATLPVLPACLRGNEPASGPARRPCSHLIADTGRDQRSPASPLSNTYQRSRLSLEERFGSPFLAFAGLPDWVKLPPLLHTRPACWSADDRCSARRLPKLF